MRIVIATDGSDLAIAAGQRALTIVQPGAEIVAADADVVVVGSHGRGPIGKALLGSVSDYLVRHVPCPVLVVRAT